METINGLKNIMKEYRLEDNLFVGLKANIKICLGMV